MDSATRIYEGFDPASFSGTYR